MDERNDRAQDRTDWAENRTDWAEDRTVMANERTYAGWMRTGMACIAIALGLKAVFGEFDPTWAARVVANVFVVIAIFIFWSARAKHLATSRRIENHVSEKLSGTSINLITWALTLGAVATGAILWWL